MKKSIYLVFLPLFSFLQVLNAQDLDEILNNLSEKKSPDYVFGTFKGTTIINGQSSEVPGHADLQFNISHRFGQINQGIYTFFGLDQGTTRLGLDYGIKDFASVSIGRNTYDKIYDGAIKIKLLKQQTGQKNIPFTLSLYTAMYVETIKWEDPERENLFSSRFSYATQLLLARKFSQRLSLQLTPSYIHKNLVEEIEDQNNTFSVGAGGRFKLTKKFSVNGEYFYLLPGTTADEYANSLSFGFDIEAAGHVFQLLFTNSQYMFAPGFITGSEGKWTDGEVFFGFNIYRVFSTKKKANQGSK